MSEPWVCGTCGQSYRVEEPGAQMATDVCTHKTGDGKTCGQVFHHGIQENNGPVRMVVWPRPETPTTDEDIVQAAVNMTRFWKTQGQHVHADKLYASMTAVFNAVRNSGHKIT